MSEEALSTRLRIGGVVEVVSTPADTPKAQEVHTAAVVMAIRQMRAAYADRLETEKGGLPKAIEQRKLIPKTATLWRAFVVPRQAWHPHMWYVKPWPRVPRGGDGVLKTKEADWFAVKCEAVSAEGLRCYSYPQHRSPHRAEDGRSWVTLERQTRRVPRYGRTVRACPWCVADLRGMGCPDLELCAGSADVREKGRVLTAYEEALAVARSEGAETRNDAAAMAAFCAEELKPLVDQIGAAGPWQVWEGAQAKGMTLQELRHLWETDRPAVHALVWVVPGQDADETDVWGNQPEPPAEGAYAEALAEAKRLGVGRCSDAAAMAAFCEADLQILVGAASPRLVWEGAQYKGMTFLQLGRLCGSDPHAVHELMWVIPLKGGDDDDAG